MGTNRYLKTTIIIRALLIALVGFYVSLFFLHQWLISPIWLVAVFCILPYAIIYFHKEREYGVGAIALISIGLLYYLDGGLYLILSMLCAVIGFYKASDAIHEDIHNKIKVSDFDIFTGELVEVFVKYMTLVYVFSFMSFYQSFNLTCEGIYFYSNKLMATALLRDKPEITDPIKKYMSVIFPSDETSATTTDHASGAIIHTGGSKYAVVETSDLAPEKPKNIISVVTSVKPGALVQTINTYRKEIIDQTIDNGDRIEFRVCELVITEIAKQYNNPNFRISVIFMMYMLISSSMELAVHLISYVNRAIFRIMFKLGRFRKYEEWEVSENLE